LEHGELANYYLAHSARADMYRRLGRTSEARTGTRAAIPARADAAAEIRKENFSWTTCRIRARPFDYIVKAGQTRGPKIIRYRKRRRHAAVSGS